MSQKDFIAHGGHLSGPANKQTLNNLHFKEILTLSGHSNMATSMDPDIKPNPNDTQPKRSPLKYLILSEKQVYRISFSSPMPPFNLLEFVKCNIFLALIC